MHLLRHLLQQVQETLVVGQIIAELKIFQDVEEVADMICRQWGGRSKVKVSSGKHPHEAGLLMLSIVKAQKELGWKPLLSTREALAWTVEWYRSACGK